MTAPNPWTLAGATFPVGNTGSLPDGDDKAGNTASLLDRRVVVTDAEAPKFANCPVSMVMVGNDADKCSASFNWPIPVATDNCGISSSPDGRPPANGSDVPVSPSPLTVTYTATDVHGNTAACSFRAGGRHPEAGVRRGHHDARGHHGGVRRDPDEPACSWATPGLIRAAAGQRRRERQLHGPGTGVIGVHRDQHEVRRPRAVLLLAVTPSRGRGR
ncbi:MAG: HYR domain-containing protein [Saprospiraceae bacterium]|nr:HYR domain-containing protein [Saprospiraceae bacterium]